MKKLLIALLVATACQHLNAEQPAAEAPAAQRYEGFGNYEEDFLNEVAAEVRQVEHERSDAIPFTWETVKMAAIAAWYMCVVEPYCASVNYCNRVIKKMLS